MTLAGRRVRAIVRKEFREYRRNRSILVAMAIFPLVFLIQPCRGLRPVGSPGGPSATSTSSSTCSASRSSCRRSSRRTRVAGERQQGTLEPVLTTPIRREEFLIGKALAALSLDRDRVRWSTPLFLAWTVVVRPAGGRVGDPQAAGHRGAVPLTPLLACLFVWVGIAISTRSTDVRVAQQLSLLGSIPAVALIALIAFDVITPTPRLTILLTVALFLADVVGWRVVSPMFDRERLVTGSR